MTYLLERPPALLFGVPVDDVTMDEAVAAIGRLVASGRRQRRTHQVATVNVDFLVNAETDHSNRALLQAADLSIADGMPILWGARSAGMPLRERVSGADLVPALAGRAGPEGWHIHLFGSSPGTAEAAAELLRGRFPGARITADSGPIISDVSAVDEDVLTRITSLDPDILCVALGNPKQERFIANNRDRLRTPVMIGVGGTFDLLIGDKKRAPVWVQRIGLEWVVRVAQEPRRLAQRYARDAWIFFPRLVTELRVLRREHRSTRGTVQIDVAGRNVTISPSPNAHGDEGGWETAAAALYAGSTLVLSLHDCPALKVRDLAVLVGMARIARREGAAISVGAIGPRLAEQMRSLKLDAFVDRRADMG